jgi:hypothetical protein
MDTRAMNAYYVSVFIGKFMLDLSNRLYPSISALLTLLMLFLRDALFRIRFPLNAEGKVASQELRISGNCGRKKAPQGGRL